MANVNTLNAGASMAAGSTAAKSPQSAHDPMGPQGTMMFDPGIVDKLMAETPKSTARSGSQVAALVGVSPCVSGRRVLLNDHRMVIGRKGGVDIMIPEPSVSAPHAKLVKGRDGWRVFNLLSSNGTFVNGEKCAEAPIKPGDKVSFGRAEFIFTMVDDETSSLLGDAKGFTTPVFVTCTFMLLLLMMTSLFYFL